MRESVLAPHFDLRQMTPRVPIDRQGEPEHPAGIGTINRVGTSQTDGTFNDSFSTLQVSAGHFKSAGDTAQGRVCPLT
jgi:hypothetical protein